MKIGRALSLAATLAVLWLLLSGHYTPLLLGFGAGSVLLVVWLAARMDLVDHEGHPLHLTLRIIPYWLWLIKEIVKSNIDVIRRVLDPRLPISPTVRWVKASETSDLGKAIYANSITLTPGTVSIDVQGDHIEIHSLTREGAEAVEEGTMDRKVAALEVGE